ncbi:DEAD/DEAH box helicase [Glaciibacter flavus]|uniref:DEAD/DEAH box helicase n=1 Tax=Orlajensenia flava TaxID=2565934 RepID=A0A4S4FUU8_9MICO|nr:DEAD/DEAH box helicase [Glaciibacter flavus]THG34244.1 DEAD/DEAH box helicase [Glaciibacter flavus]
MPKNKKAAGGRPAKNFDPSYSRGGSKGGPKAGSRSPGHRGYKPEPDAPARRTGDKARWNADERAARPASSGGDRRGHGDRPERGSYGDRPARGDRPSYGNDRPARGDRPAYGDRQPRGDRPAYGDRQQRDDRGPRSFDRDDRSSSRDRGPRANADSDRPSYGNDRPARGDRPAHGDRQQRDDRRPSYGNDRPARDRPSYNDDRGSRNERPARGDRRPAYNNDRPAPDDRPARGDRRPSYNNDRPAYGDREPRTDRSSGDRSFNDRSRDDRAPRRYDRDERPARRDDRSTYSNDRNDRGGSYSRPGFQKSERSESKFYPAKDSRKPAYLNNDDVVLERLEAEAIQAADVDGVTFADLGLGTNVVRSLDALGAATPFPIQAATIPDVLAGRDVLGRGKTGSGKTIAFGAPTVERLMAMWADSGKSGGKRQMGRKPRALILAPTRELALQIDRTVQPIAQSVGLFTTQIYGGVPQHRQVGALQRGVDIVIGTPGRIEDLIEQGRLDLSEVAITVLDEADHMCDLGFLEPVQRIIRETKDGGQKLLFSATLDKGVAALVDEFLVDPSVHEVAGEDQASSTIDHRVLLIEQRDKLEIIKQLADREGKTLVFARTRAFAEQLAEDLDYADIPAVSLHGDLNQSRRTRNLQQLTSGRVSVLVATDVAARGIHVDDIDLVIQADAPDEYKTYLHRSGRTGRAGKQGTVVTLITRSRQRRMAELLDRAEIEADFEHVAPGDELMGQLTAGL